MHCHNTVHEDHQMMLLWQIADVGDNNRDAMTNGHVTQAPGTIPERGESRWNV